MGHPTDPLMRVATSGTEATGKNYGNSPATAGLVLTSAGPDLPPDWAPPVSPVARLTLTRVVDIGTSVALADQRGTFTAPYATMAQAVADLPAGGTVLVVPGDYGTQVWAFNSTGTTSVLNLAGLWNSIHGNPDQYVLAPAITSTHGLVLQGIDCASTVTGPTAFLWAKYCAFDAPVAVQAIVAENCTFDLLGEVTTTDPETNFIGCFFNRLGTVLTTPAGATFRETTFSAANAIVVSGGGGTIVFDQATFNDFWTHTCTTNGTYVVLGTPLSGVEATPANPTLAAGRTLLATIPITGVFSQPCVVANFCGAVPPTGVMVDAKLAAGPAIEIYINNYTGGPLAYPGSDVRWKILAP